MSVEVKIELPGESVSSAIVAEWVKKVGDYVEADDLLVELETDKINVPIHAPVAGKIAEIKAATDDEVNDGDIIAVIDESATGGASDSAPASSPDATVPAAAAEAEQQPTTQPAGDQPLSPAVARLIEEHSLDASTIPASGPNGRLLKGDVLAYVESRPAASAAPQARAKAPAAPADPGARQERERMSKLRQTVARRLVEAQQTAAILTTFNEVDMSAVMELRNKYKAAYADKYGVKLGFMSFFVKASIEALKAYPRVNAFIDDNAIVYNNYYNVGVAIGGGRGLVVPIIRDADQMSFAEIELEINRLAKLARDNRLQLDDLQGGTFTLSNGGVYGSMLSTPILNPPQSGILGMHNIVERPVAIDGQVVIRPIMYLALSYDHRIVDGREAVSFLVRIKQCIEDPERILLEI